MKKSKSKGSRASECKCVVVLRASGCMENTETEGKYATRVRTESQYVNKCTHKRKESPITRVFRATTVHSKCGTQHNLNFQPEQNIFIRIKNRTFFRLNDCSHRSSDIVVVAAVFQSRKCGR